MDPLSIATSTAAVVTAAGRLLKLLHQVYSTIQDAPILLSTITTECTVVHTSLGIIQQLLVNKSKTADSSFDNVSDVYELALVSCTQILSVIEKDVQSVLKATNSPHNLDSVKKIKHILSKDHLQELVSQLRGQHQALSLLMNALQSRSMSDMNDNLQDNRDILKGLVKRARHLSIAQEDSSDFRSLDDIVSLRDVDSIATSTRFAFDDQLLQSPAYQRRLAYLRKLQNRLAELEGHTESDAVTLVDPTPERATSIPESSFNSPTPIAFVFDFEKSKQKSELPQELNNIGLAAPAKRPPRIGDEVISQTSFSNSLPNHCDEQPSKDTTIKGTCGVSSDENTKESSSSADMDPKSRLLPMNVSNMRLRPPSKSPRRKFSMEFKRFWKRQKQVTSSETKPITLDPVLADSDDESGVPKLDAVELSSDSKSHNETANGYSSIGVALGQSEELSFFKDYYSDKDIHIGDKVSVAWAYQPRAGDEFDLTRGEMLKVVSFWDDGWATGTRVSDRAEEYDYDSNRKTQISYAVFSGTSTREESPPPTREIKAFPLVCVCLPEVWKKTVRDSLGMDSKEYLTKPR